MKKEDCRTLEGETNQIDLLADEKLEDEDENLEQKKIDLEIDREESELIERLNKMSNILKVNVIYEAIDKIDNSSKDFNLSNILKQLDQPELSDSELADFLIECSKNGLLKKYPASVGESILADITKSKSLEEFNLDDVTYKKVISALKDLLRTNQLKCDQILSSLNTKYDLLLNCNLVQFNNLIRNKLINNGKSYVL